MYQLRLPGDCKFFTFKFVNVTIKNRDLWSETMYLILPDSPNKTQLTSSSAKIRNSLFCFLKRPFNSVLSKGIRLLCVGILYSRAKFKLRRCRVRHFLMILNFKDR